MIYCTKKQEHSFSILKAFFVRYSSGYETSDNDRTGTPTLGDRGAAAPPALSTDLIILNYFSAKMFIMCPQ